MGSIVSDVVGAVFGSTTQSRSADKASDRQYEAWQAQRQDMLPWTQAGGQAIGQLSAGMQPGGQFASATPTMDQLNADPILKMMMSKDNNAAAAYASSVGNYGGSSMLGALQDIQSNEYGQAYGRWQGAQNTLYNRLAGIANTGMVGQQSVGAQGQNAASQAGMYGIMGGNAQAAGYGALGSALGYGADAYLRYQGMRGAGGGYDWSSLYGGAAGAGAGSAAGASDLAGSMDAFA